MSEWQPIDDTDKAAQKAWRMALALHKGKGLHNDPFDELSPEIIIASAMRDMLPTCQPIETAPMDGKPILSWDGIQFAVIAWAGLSHPEWVLLEGENKPHENCSIDWEPTHWMPLPEPPEEME